MVEPLAKSIRDVSLDSETKRALSLFPPFAGSARFFALEVLFRFYGDRYQNVETLFRNRSVRFLYDQVVPADQDCAARRYVIRPANGG
jgi:hypothetical protein